MRTHRWKQLTAVLAVLIALFACAPAQDAPALSSPSSPSSSDPAGSSSSGQEEPIPILGTFTATDLAGEEVDQSIFEGYDLTMVNIWATFCGPCLNEMPGLGELAAEHDAEEFQIIGVVSDVREGDDQALVESLVQETGANYPHLLANDSLDQALLSGVSSVPTTFFFDGEGAYLGGVVGSAEKSAWEELIHELLEKV